MSIRVGTSWRSGPGRRSWNSLPLWLWLILALPAAALFCAAGCAWLLVQAIRWGVIGGQALAQAWREEHAAKAAKP